jgi:hypothetical protein
MTTETKLLKKCFKALLCALAQGGESDRTRIESVLCELLQNGIDPEGVLISETIEPAMLARIDKGLGVAEIKARVSRIDEMRAAFDRSRAEFEKELETREHERLAAEVRTQELDAELTGLKSAMQTTLFRLNKQEYRRADGMPLTMAPEMQTLSEMVS